MRSFPFESKNIGSKDEPKWDRAITAKDERDFNKCCWTNGVFPVPLNGLMVEAKSGMTIKVNKGACHIEGSRAIEREERTFNINAAHNTYSRIDYVVARFDTSEDKRNIELYVKTGNASSTPEPPELLQQPNYYELALAEIRVPAKVQEITNSMITDTRLNDKICGIVVPAIPHKYETQELWNQIKESIDIVNKAVEGALSTEAVSMLEKKMDEKIANIKQVEIVNNLNSGGTDKALSAEQGKVLFRNVNEGKRIIANAIIDKGGSNVSNNSSFGKLADGIKHIKTGYAAGDTLTSKQYEIINVLESRKVVDAAKVNALYADEDDNLYVLGPDKLGKYTKDGARIWENNDGVTNGVLGSDGNTVYIITEGYAYVYDAKNGNRIKIYGTYSNYEGGGFAIRGDIIVVQETSMEATVYKNGVKKGEIKAYEAFYTITEDSIYASDYKGIHVFNINTLQEKALIDSGVKIGKVYDVDSNGDIYFSDTNSSRTSIYKMSNNKIEWELNCDGPPQQIKVGASKILVLLASSSTPAEKYILIVSKDGKKIKSKRFDTSYASTICNNFETIYSKKYTDEVCEQWIEPLVTIRIKE